MTIYFWKPGQKYGVFSNWYLKDFELDGITFNCSEQAMMYLKAKLFNDEESCKEILKTKDPKKQKDLGRKVRGFQQDVWNKNKVRIMVKILYAKFKGDLKSTLLETKEYKLAEASPYDKIWGIGLSPEDAEKGLPWKGQNLLGEALMIVRSMLINNENQSRS
jgi:ribA/ribD-fused uncharacterized protein